jgi:hypothetical protein
MWCMDLDTWCAASQAFRGNIGDDRGSRLAFGETGMLHGLWLGDFICCHAAEFVRCDMRHPDVKYKDRRLNYSPPLLTSGASDNTWSMFFITGTVLPHRMDLLS